MEIKSRLKPEGSFVSGIAVAGTVFAIYNMDLGSAAQSSMSDANHPLLETNRKKAAYTSFIAVSALTLLSKDANVGILGYAAMIAADLHYRQAIMADPTTGTMVPPAESVYSPAMYSVPPVDQGQPEAVGY